MKENINVEVLEVTNENKRNNYKVRISYNGNEYETIFHDSIYNYENGIGLDINDVIYAVLLDARAYEDSRDLEDFASEFGYDLYDEFEEDYNPELLRVYNECHKTFNALDKMFTKNELEQLHEEFAEY